jgi:hypothetical protein
LSLVTKMGALYLNIFEQPASMVLFSILLPSRRTVAAFNTHRLWQ